MPKKLILDIDDATWKDVIKFKIDNDLKNNNEAVVTLIKRSLYTGNPKPPKSKP
ncbi:MAG: hypothetical protein M1540_03420 [Candidatus Bathyarchaeota archaeon]|nr:hypothetical protein [Candidatus Bathyarchaeota archaeon]